MNTNLVSYKEYIVDTESHTYKAVWNCQVEWTVECIYYDAETGRVSVDDDGIEFICEHQIRVTKSEYRDHAYEASLLPSVSENDLRRMLEGRREAV